jgi:hypothetical protein
MQQILVVRDLDITELGYNGQNLVGCLVLCTLVCEGGGGVSELS